MSNFKNRIKEIRTVKGKDIRPNPHNWRVHPYGQKQALKGILSEIGIAGVPICYENAKGELVALDGHCRLHDVGKDQEWQVAVLDITEEEAKKLIAVYDPISEMAEPDPQALTSLLGEVKFTDVDLNSLLKDIAVDNGVTLTELDDSEIDVEIAKPLEKIEIKKKYPIVIDCHSEEEREEVLQLLNLPTDKKRIDAAFILKDK